MCTQNADPLEFTECFIRGNNHRLDDIRRDTDNKLHGPLWTVYESKRFEINVRQRSQNEKHTYMNR